MNSKLISYAMDFSSFLIQKIKEKEKIRNIILFGSVSRDEANKKSDIDIFIDLIKEEEHKVFFVWENIKPNSKRVLFNKQMFGYKQNKKFYQGLIQKYNGER